VRARVGVGFNKHFLNRSLDTTVPLKPFPPASCNFRFDESHAALKLGMVQVNVRACLLRLLLNFRPSFRPQNGATIQMEPYPGKRQHVVEPPFSDIQSSAPKTR